MNMEAKTMEGRNINLKGLENKITASKKDPTIFVIDDDQEMRNSLCWLMESVKLNIEVYDSAISFLKNYQSDRTGCILLDVRMPMMSGLELMDKLNEHNNRIPIIFITGHGDIPMAIRAMKGGAADFILKPFNSQQLIEQIQRAITQSASLSKCIQDTSISENYASLTAREREIMELVVAGKLNKQIAHELSIAISTVEFHRARMMKKMQARNIAQLVQMKMNLDLQSPRAKNLPI